MMWSIDSCQSRVSADQYHLTVLRAQVPQVTSFQMIARSSLFFQKFIWNTRYVVFMSLWPRTINILISNWPRTRKLSQLFKNTGGGDLFLPWSHVGHALRPIFMLWLVKIWHVSSCHSWSWQSFVSTCDVFNCLFPLDVPNEIQLLSRVFYHSWLVCLLGFWLRNVSLVKVGNPISDGIVFVFYVAWCIRGLKRLKRLWPYLIH